jgi:hypothetical protein
VNRPKQGGARRLILLPARPRRSFAERDERTEAAARPRNLVAAMTRPSSITPGSCGLTTPSPPAEKATTHEDQARHSEPMTGAGTGACSDQVPAVAGKRGGAYGSSARSIAWH